MAEPNEFHMRKAQEWAREKWGKTFAGYPIEVEAYAHGLAASDVEICNLTEALTSEGNERDAARNDCDDLRAVVREMLDWWDTPNKEEWIPVLRRARGLLNKEAGDGE